MSAPGNAPSECIGYGANCTCEDCTMQDGERHPGRVISSRPLPTVADLPTLLDEASMLLASKSGPELALSLSYKLDQVKAAAGAQRQALADLVEAVNREFDGHEDGEMLLITSEAMDRAQAVLDA